MGERDQIFLGIALLLGSVFIMALGDAVVKLLSGHLSVWQIFVLRSLAALPCLALIAHLFRLTADIQLTGWVVLRSLLLVLGWLAYYAALPVVDLSLAAVALYTNPIMITLLAALFIGDRIAPRQWVGVALGFLGVLTILRPNEDGFSWPLLLPLLAAFFYAIAMIITRTRCQNISAIGLAYALQLTFILVGGAAIAALMVMSTGPQAPHFLLTAWAPMSQTDLAILGALGLIAALFSLGVARAYQIAPPHILATFDYGYLVSAVIWAVILFGEKPDVWALTGMALITMAGLIAAPRRHAHKT